MEKIVPPNEYPDESPDLAKAKLELSEEDVEKIRTITSGTEIIPTEIRERATEDVVSVMENGHPLNRVWRDENGAVIGYLAFEDFEPKQAYAKYFSTEGLTSENAFSTIKETIDRAIEEGYTKIHYHGWNPRLNHILTRFGFVRTHTDKWQEHSADHFELNLSKEPRKISEKEKESFENKYKIKLIKEIDQTTAQLKPEEVTMVDDVHKNLASRIKETKIEKFEFTEQSELILKLKIARYLQRHDSIDVNTLFDAIVETPKFIHKEKGGFDRLLEIHEQKTLEKIAEIRRKKAEQTGDESFNPYEALFQTDSGKYYMARLLNMPHLEEESEYMDHCVGTSDSYINRMKKGDVEILSFRDTQSHRPIITIEYNVKTRTIVQIKKAHDYFLKSDDPFYTDFIEALDKLRTTENDSGNPRSFDSINPSELQNIDVRDYHLLTRDGEVSFRDFDPTTNQFVIKMGKMEITDAIPKSDAVKIMKIVEGIDVMPEQIAHNIAEVNKTTEVYIGDWNPEIYNQIKQFPNIKHLYEKFPKEKIFMYELETNPEINSPESAEKALKDKNIYLSDPGKDILYKTEFSSEQKQYKLVQFTVKQLGFPNGATINEIYAKAEELGLQLCPAEVGPHLRLSYGGKDWKHIAMKQISAPGGHPDVFYLYFDGGQRGLYGSRACPGGRWGGGNRFIFLANES